MGRKDKSSLRENLRQTPSIIWHGLISFEAAFGERYVPDGEAAQKLMKIEFPRFLKHAGFDSDKIEWFAGLHENTRHKHIHFAFFEKEPSRFTPHKKGLYFTIKGQLAKYALERFKIRIEQRLTDISSEIKAARKELLDITKNLLFSPKSKIRYQSDIQDGLDKLIAVLPKSGRLSYDSANMEPFKPRINKIIDALIKTSKPLFEKFNAFSRRAKQKDSDTLKMLKSNKVDESEWNKYLVADKYLADLYRRLGNQILTSLKGAKGKERFSKGRLAKKHIRRRTLQNVFSYVLKLNSEFEQAAVETFDDFLRRLDEEKEKNQEEIFEYEMK